MVDISDLTTEDVQIEYDLIQQKKSDLPYSKRQMIINIVETPPEIWDANDVVRNLNSGRLGGDMDGRDYLENPRSGAETDSMIDERI
jgi:hypothetical protein